MREFDKYWNKEEIELAKEVLGVCHPKKVIAGNAWKTALKQVLAKINPYESDAKNIIAVFNFIEEELGEQ